MDGFKDCRVFDLAPLEARRRFFGLVWGLPAFLMVLMVQYDC